jgi:TolB protein
MNRRRVLAAIEGTAVAALLAGFGHRSACRADQGDELPGRLRRLTAPGTGDNRATFLPDGKTILFASKRSGKSQIWAMDRDGSNPRRLHESEANDYGRVAPNTDGSRICFSSDRRGLNAVYVLDFGSGRTAAVSDLSFWSFGPTWSSRDLIAYFSKKGGNMLNIWTVRPDGSEARQISNLPGESRQPWWSPDGSTLAISADRGTGLFNVWLLGSDGSDMGSITNHGSYVQPFWSPDGKRIAVSARLHEPQSRIYIMNADGSMLRPISQSHGDDNVHPAWSPDGRSIVFTSGKDMESSLHLFDIG